MSDTNMNAAAGAKEPDATENARAEMPNEDMGRVNAAARAARLVDAIFGKRRKGPSTPSERIVKLAQDRDIVYDIIKHATDEFNEESDDAQKAYLKKYIDALTVAKDATAERIRALLAET